MTVDLRHASEDALQKYAQDQEELAKELREREKLMRKLQPWKGRC